MNKQISLAELACIMGISIWTVGEWHTHVETQSIQRLYGATDGGLRSNLRSAYNEMRSLRQTLRETSATEEDEFKSRAILTALLDQAGLSQFEFPEITQILNPKSALPLQLKIAQRKGLVEALPTIAPADGWLASGFGDRLDPMSKTKSDHRGLDISNNEGTLIRASANGIVRYAAKYGRFGNYIAIVHGSGIVTKYAHLKEVRVKAGQPVTQGEIIAVMGNTGKSTGSHLHYEVWINDKAFNPSYFIPKVLQQNAKISINHTTVDNLPERRVIEMASRH